MTAARFIAAHSLEVALGGFALATLAAGFGAYFPARWLERRFCK